MENIHLIAENQTLFLVLVAFFSLFVGSFLNVVIYRLPKMMAHEWGEECRLYLGLKPHEETETLNLCWPNSHCPNCKQAIKPWHNIPVISYFLLNGRCRACHSHISLRYPFIEIFTAALSVYIAYHFGFTLQTLGGLIFTWIGIALVFIDLDHHLLPDQLTLSLLWVGLLLSLYNVFCDPKTAILGAIAGYSIFALTQAVFGWMTGKTGMGQGDYKYLAAIGAYLGWPVLPFVIILASLSGILFAVIQMVIKQEFKSTPLPFGPYLALAGWITMVFGPEIMQNYLSVFSL